MMSEKSEKPPGSSHLYPAPMGVTVKTTIERGNPYMTPRLYNVEITLLDIVRGKEAVERLYAQGLQNVPLVPDIEYVLALIRFGYFHRGRGLNDTYQLTEGQFVAASVDSGNEYETPSFPQQPQPQLIDCEFSPGNSREGWIILQVPEEDKRPLLIFKRERSDGVYGIWGHLWFELYSQEVIS